jgi:site-specific recombinase XerD
VLLIPEYVALSMMSSTIKFTLGPALEKTGLNCNPHTFRRTFASNLYRAGLDVEHIMRLGGWESLDIVSKYTRSVRFEESLKVYQSFKRHMEFPGSLPTSPVFTKAW